MVARVNECGHKNREHRARGMCGSCYNKWLAITNQSGKRPVNRSNECGHSERKHEADGMCRRCWERKYYATSGGEIIRKRKRRMYANSNGKAKVHARGLRLKYGLTTEEYTTMQESQGGLCSICNQKESKMVGDVEQKLAVDHCHRTNKIRGLLCGNCNRMLGLAKDNAKTLRAAALYLEISSAFPAVIKSHI